MIRFFFGLLLMATVVGCTNIQSVGPFAKPSGPLSSANPKLDKELTPPDPVMVPAPTPTPPKCLVHAEDVNWNNAALIQQQLKEELESDRKNMPSVPVTAEVSELHGRH